MSCSFKCRSPASRGFCSSSSILAGWVELIGAFWEFIFGWISIGFMGLAEWRDFWGLTGILLARRALESFRPSGFTPAFGREVAPSARRFVEGQA
jgi:hypothetical protein